MKEKVQRLVTRFFGPLDTYEKKNSFILFEVAMAACVVGLIMDLMMEIYDAALAAAIMFVGFPLLGSRLFKKGKEQTFSVIVLSIFSFGVVPAYFFKFDGTKGGAVPMMLAFIVLITLCLNGKRRVVMMVLELLIIFALYLIEWKWPEFISFHARKDYIIDSLQGLMISVGIAYLLLRFQTTLLHMEAKRAQRETAMAEEAKRSQSRFFSSMSHEIRTPINSILGLNEIILRQEDATEEVKRDARNIQGAGRMLLSLVNDILDISKIEAGKMDIVPVNYDVGTLISEIVNMIWIKAEEKGLKLTVDVDPSIPAELFGDEVRIRQILINLLNNAVKYTKEGSVSLHMECESRTEEQVLLILAVTDTGMGVKKEALPYLFNSFQRVDEEKNRKIEGTGLGLSIVKQLVELMGGKITVDSVYGQGSTFTVALSQRISDNAQIGDINIANYTEGSSTDKYMSSFQAPEARVLFVDDNEMNLEVEVKLLKDTGIAIDTALSGRRALELALVDRYDAIFLDHLMPEMDGIECLARLRKQTGGLNKQVPVIVLTANAGSENRELYARSGFDDYLVKPVSGKQLEDMLIRHLPEKKVHRLASDRNAREMNTAKDYLRKIPVAITTSSMCDLPETVLERLEVDIIPFSVQTESGVFLDIIEAGADELVHYMSSEKNKLRSEPPSQVEFENFFSAEVRKAHHVLHIALTSSMSEEYERAVIAARAFENVTVINSECLSSATGILVMAACYMAEHNEPYERIIEEVERVKKLIHCSFVVTQPEYMMRQGYIGKSVYMFMKSLNLHPALRVRNDRFGVARIWTGKVKKCFERYIRYALPNSADPDPNVIFVTHVNLSAEEMKWIEEEIKKLFRFDHIIFQKASAAISVNCGPGTFGLLYMEKDSKAYHWDSYLMEENELEDEEAEELETDENTAAAPNNGSVNAENDGSSGTGNGGFRDKEGAFYRMADNFSEETETEPQWYECIEGIDGKAAIKNSGSEDALKTVLKIFYDSIDAKSKEIEGYYQSGDWQNFTIKVHALKSSARLVGALELGEHAQAMENAGKAGNLDYINSNYDSLMDEYLQYKGLLSGVFGVEDGEEEDRRPVADQALMESVYETLKEAAEDMDITMIEETFDELKDYAIPDSEKERFAAIRECFEQFDYEGMATFSSLPSKKNPEHSV